MIGRIFMALVLVAITVAIHAGGISIALRHTQYSAERLSARFWPVAWLLVRIAWLLIVFHLCEIAVWALFYSWQHCLPDAESSFYFSGVTYATLGYGDLVLPQEWRLFGPLEALVGSLMCGLSVAFFFGVLAKQFLKHLDAEQTSADL